MATIASLRLCEPSRKNTLNAVNTEKRIMEYVLVISSKCHAWKWSSEAQAHYISNLEMVVNVCGLISREEVLGEPADEATITFE